MKNVRVDINPQMAFYAEYGSAGIILGAGDTLTESDTEFTLDDLGAISEWLAVAWENVAGEPYEHREYDKTAWPQVKPGEWVIPKDHISDPEFNKGMDFLEDFAKIASKLPRTVRVERDCE